MHFELSSCLGISSSCCLKSQHMKYMQQHLVQSQMQTQLTEDSWALTLSSVFTSSSFTNESSSIFTCDNLVPGTSSETLTLQPELQQAISWLIISNSTQARYKQIINIYKQIIYIYRQVIYTIATNMPTCIMINISHWETNILYSAPEYSSQTNKYIEYTHPR